MVAPSLIDYDARRHIHEGRGDWQVRRTVLANVTIVDEDYRNVYQPWEYKIEVAE
jgi:hypothetical protein